MNRMNKRRKYCRFTALGVDEIDYKDLDTLKAYITETGKIMASRNTGTKEIPTSVGNGRQAGAVPRFVAVYRSTLRSTPWN